MVKLFKCIQILWIKNRYEYEHLSDLCAAAAAAVSGVDGDVWALVRMMVVDYTQPQMMCCPAHITMNASLSHFLYIMATTPQRGQASSRLINPLTPQPKEKWEARQRCSLLIHRLYLTPQPWIAYVVFVISLYTWWYSQQEIIHNGALYF